MRRGQRPSAEPSASLYRCPRGRSGLVIGGWGQVAGGTGCV